MVFKEVRELSSIDTPKEPFVVRCDNKSAIDFTRNRVERSKTRHIDIAHHLTREMHEEGLIQLRYVSSGDNVADIFTKALPCNVMSILVEKLRLYYH